MQKSEIKHPLKIILNFIQATSFYGKVDGMEGLDWAFWRKAERQGASFLSKAFLKGTARGSKREPRNLQK